MPKLQLPFSVEDSKDELIAGLFLCVIKMRHSMERDAAENSLGRDATPEENLQTLVMAIKWVARSMPPQLAEKLHESADGMAHDLLAVPSN